VTGESESLRVYLHFREVFGSSERRVGVDARRREAKAAISSAPFGKDRDPAGLGAVLASVTRSYGWTSQLSKAELLGSWREIVGDETADRSEPVSLEEGLLVVSCSSTAWATELRRMRTDIVTRIAVRFPDAGVESVRFDGPGVPSWKRGPRSIPGRGPRDTYG